MQMAIQKSCGLGIKLPMFGLRLPILEEEQETALLVFPLAIVVMWEPDIMVLTVRIYGSIVQTTLLLLHKLHAIYAQEQAPQILLMEFLLIPTTGVAVKPHKQPQGFAEEHTRL